MKITVILSRDVALKVRHENILKKLIDGSLNLNVICARNQCTVMPNKHSPDKEPLSLDVPRVLMGKIKTRAKILKVKVSAYVVAILNERTQDVTLTSDDYEKITQATRHAEKTGRRCATPFDGPKIPKGKTAS